MKRGLFLISIMTGLLLNLSGFGSQVQIAYQNALDYIKKGDFEKALDWLEIVIKDFPKTQQAKKAKVLKAVILGGEIETSLFLLTEKLHQALQTAVLRENQEKILKLFLTHLKRILKRAFEFKKTLKEILALAGTPLEIEATFPSLSEMELYRAVRADRYLEFGIAPSSLEMEALENQARILKMKSLFYEMIGISTEEQLENMSELFKASSKKGKIVWDKALIRLGNLLLTMTIFCDVTKERENEFPIPELKNLSWNEIEKMYLVAQDLFKKVNFLTKDNIYSKSYLFSLKRIDEIDGALKKVREKKKLPR